MNRRRKKKRDKFHELRKRWCPDASYSEMRQIDRQYHELMVEIMRHKRRTEEYENERIFAEIEKWFEEEE